MKNSRDREKSRNDAIHRFTWGLWGEERGRLGPLIDRSSGEGQENGVCIIADGNGPESPFSPILFRQRLSNWVTPCRSKPPRYARSTKLHRAFPSLINFGLENSTHARKSQFSNFFREILLEDLEDRGRNELFLRDVNFSFFFISRDTIPLFPLFLESNLLLENLGNYRISHACSFDKISYPSYRAIQRRTKLFEFVTQLWKLAFLPPRYFTYSTDRRQRERRFPSVDGIKTPL